MRHLEAHADIDAPPEKVWAVLTDLAAYPVWNPFIVRAAGELREGQRLRITQGFEGLARAVKERTESLGPDS